MLRDRLVAHRGYQQHYPENSLLGHRKAIEAGATFIETDILFSADSKPVLYHDITMMRISDREEFVHGHSLEALEQIPAWEPKRLGELFADNTITPLAHLVALLEQHPEVTAFIEVKRGGIEILGIEAAYEAVTTVLAPVAEQCVLISFNDEFIASAREQGYQRLGVVLKSWDDLENGTVIQTKPEFIFCDADKIPEGKTLHEIESTTVVYEVTEPDAAIEWFRRGADMVETFDIGGMLEQLAHRAL